MSKLDQDIAEAAGDTIEVIEYFTGCVVDYSPASLSSVEEALEKLSAATDELTAEQLTTAVRQFGCYVLEVGRKEFGGRYAWYDRRDQPVLVVGEPDFRVAMITWDKVRGRLTGDKADNIPFFYAGFAERARQAKPGDDALYV